jgi:hypothetical protein
MDFSTAALVASLLTAPVTPDSAPLGPRLPASRFPVTTLTAPAPQDFEYSKAYYTRLTIHRWGSYTMLPLFVAQAYVGSRLYNDTGGDWAADLHPILAGGVGLLFTSNTITGVWNLYEGRKDPKDRRRKVTHAILMLTADAGFVTTGILGSRAADDADGRSVHRAVAIGSMAVATTGFLLMTDLFRRDE